MEAALGSLAQKGGEAAALAKRVRQQLEEDAMLRRMRRNLAECSGKTKAKKAKWKEANKQLRNRIVEAEKTIAKAARDIACYTRILETNKALSRLPDLESARLKTLITGRETLIMQRGYNAALAYLDLNEGEEP